MTMADDLRYPVGRFDWDAPRTAASLRAALEELAVVPENARRAVHGLDDAQFETPYRPGGWSVRQVVHHLADSHVHGYVRLKLALTEENPEVRPYDQDAWAGLSDSRLPVVDALALLDSVNQRWKALCGAIAPPELTRVYTHAALGPLTVETHLHFYAWHARHHTAQVTALRAREGW